MITITTIFPHSFAKDGKDISGAVTRALINTALAIRDAEQNEMRSIFDNPTPWTLRAITAKALPEIAAVEVGVLDPYWHRADDYLSTQAEGGSRKRKAMETALQKFGILPSGWSAVPGNWARLDAYGNISRGQIMQILAWLDASESWAGHTSDMGRKGRANKDYEYVSIRPGNKQSLIPGVYERRDRALLPVLLFVKKVGYKKIFDFEGVAHKVFGTAWPRKLASALAKGQR